MSCAAAALLALLLSAAASAAPLPASRPSARQVSPPAGPVRILGSISGRVLVRKKGARRFLPVRTAPIALEGGETLRTGPRGSAIVVFADGSRVDLGRQSLVSIESDGPSLVSLLLSIGRLRASVAARPGRAFRVQTPAAVASVRGTRFSVEAPSPERAIIVVDAGRVHVRAVKKRFWSRGETMLSAGERVAVDASGLGRIIQAGKLERFPPPGPRLPTRD